MSSEARAAARSSLFISISKVSSSESSGDLGSSTGDVSEMPEMLKM